MSPTEYTEHRIIENEDLSERKTGVAMHNKLDSGMKTKKIICL